MQHTLSPCEEKKNLPLSQTADALVKPHHLISQTLIIGIMIAFLFFWLSACACLSDCPSGPPPLQSPTRSVAPSRRPTPAAFGPDFYNNAFWHYFDLVLNQQYRQAYGMLSSAQQSQEPYADFIVNDNYTLFKGCWTVVKIPISQQEHDGRTWNVGVELTYTSCFDKCTISYYWDFHFQLDQDHPVIVAVGLYPTGTNC
jgi:hypothetical protein